MSHKIFYILHKMKLLIGNWKNNFFIIIIFVNIFICYMQIKKSIMNLKIFLK